MLDTSKLVTDLYQVHQSISSQLLLLEAQCSSLSELTESKTQDFTEQTGNEIHPKIINKPSTKTDQKVQVTPIQKEMQELLSAADTLLAKAQRVKMKYGIATSSKTENKETKLTVKPLQEEEKQPPMDPVKQSFQNNFGNNFPDEFRTELSTYWNNVQEDLDASSKEEEAFISRVALSVPIEQEKQNELSTATLQYGLMMAVSELQQKILELLSSYTPGNSAIAKTVVHLHTKTLQHLNLIQQGRYFAVTLTQEGQPMEAGVLDYMIQSLDTLLQHVENQTKVRKREAPIQREKTEEKFPVYHPSQCWLPQSCSVLEGLDEMLFPPVEGKNPQSKYMYENITDLQNVEWYRHEIQWKLLQFHLESQIAEIFLPWLSNCSVQSKEDQRLFLVLYSFVVRMLASQGSNQTCRFVPRGK